MDARIDTEIIDSAGGQLVDPEPRVPDYLTQFYWWAYLHPRGMRIFDHTAVVQAILWGNYGRLKRAALAEVSPGARVLQAACVYGDFSPDLARRIGPTGGLEVIDIVPAQVANCRKKLEAYPWSRVRLGDATEPAPAEAGSCDQVCCFFLLHEVPDDQKGAVVDALLARLRPGGKAVFVDYHRTTAWHPLRPVMALVFHYLEPFAKTLWREEISSFAGMRQDFEWRKETLFGGLYQKVTAVRKG